MSHNMTLEDKLEELRRSWKINPSKRKTIEYQAKLIGMAIDVRDEITEKNVRELILK